MVKKRDVTSFGKDLYRISLITWNAGKGLAAANMLLLICTALLPIVSLYYIKLLVELIVNIKHTDFNSVYPVIIGFCVAQSMLAVINQVFAYINTVQQQQLSDHLSEIVLKKAIEVDYEYYENPQYHDSLHLAQQQSLYKAGQMLGNINNLISNSLSLLFLIGLFFTIQWVYALLFIALSIPLAVIKWYYGYQAFRLERKLVPAEREGNYYHQVLSGAGYAKEVRIFGIGRSFIEKYKNIRLSIFYAKKGLNARLTWYSIAAQLIEAVVMVYIFIMLAKNAWAGAISAGVFVIYIQGFQRIQSASKNFLQSLVQMFQQRLFLKDLFAFLDIESQHNDAKGKIFPQAKEGISIEGLSFNYPQTDKEVLHDINLRCAPGNIIAIVGENSSGKSTIVKLLARLYTPGQGSIKIDGEDIHSISIASYTANSIFLAQDFEKYHLTVEENIQLAGGSKIKITDAATMADADSFINKLSKKYQTRLGRSFEKSEQLSGGQWQKLAIARVFYKNAQLVVMDEPTSSIDAIAEHAIFSKLRAYAKDKMVIIISHRLYNLKIADNIYVMKDGRIAEEGDYDTLIKMNGIFRHMYDNQKL